MSRPVLHKTEPWDAIVIGSGATGGWAALELGRQGLRVLVLEAGPDQMDAPSLQPPAELDLKRTFDRVTGRRRVQSRHAAYWMLDPDLFVVDSDHPYQTPPGKDFSWIRTRSVNGRLLTWGGIGVRTSDYEFRAPEQDGFGSRWPIGYAELREHYDRVDDFLQVYGECDGLPQLPDGKYVGAARLTDAERRFQQAIRTHFDRPVIASRGVLVWPAARPNGEAPAPSAVRAAVQRHQVTLRSNAVVSHILVDATGKATGVVFIDRLTKQTEEVRARSVALCASTLESTRIMLNSRSRHHPQGLGNSSGTLGHYLMDHPGVYVAGFAPGERDRPWNDGYTGARQIMIPRYHNLENRAGGDFLRGFGAFGHIGRTPAAKDQCDADEVAVGLTAFGEMLPRHENHVSLNTDVKDAWGLPTLDIDCGFSDNERALQDFMIDSMVEMIEAAGGRMHGAPSYLSPGGFVHEAGTARMGDDAKTSVLNGYAQCWDVANVFVMDGAAWPSGAWQNPTFTMMAIAGRASAHLADQLKQGKL